MRSLVVCMWTVGADKLTRCAEYGRMHVRKGLLPFPQLERF